MIERFYKEEYFMQQHYWVEGREGKMISTMVHSPSALNAPVIVYMHGFTGNKIGGNRIIGVKLARYLCSLGYAVVRFDCIGSGESEGEFANDTIFSGWIEDAKAILCWIDKLGNIDKNRIGLLGHSLGGALVTYMSSIDKRIKTTCALAPVSNLINNFKNIIIGPDLWKESMNGEHIHHFYGAKYSLSPNFVQDLHKYNILDAAKNIHQPFLIIHGEKDAAVPVNDSYTLFDSLASLQKDLKVFPDEEHLFTNDIYNTIVQWFEQTL